MNREILKLAIPNIISNISVPLLSTVDTALMGRMSELHIGAVGLGAMIFNFIYWNFGFLRMGTTGLTAQAYGKASEEEYTLVLGRALFIGGILALIIMLLQIPLEWASVYLMQVSENQQTLVADYFFTRIWAAPATLAIYALTGWFFGMQNAIYPLIITVATNVVNILASVVLVYYWGWEVKGVALGTVIAQYTGFLVALILFERKYGYLMQYLRPKTLFLWTEFQRFLNLNLDIFIRTFFLTFVFGFFYSQSSSEGALMLAVNVILLQFVNWMSYGVDGFAFAAESLVGKYAGTGDPSKTNQAIRVSFFWGMGIAVPFGLTYWFFGDVLLRIYTDQDEVILAAQPFLIWMILFPIISTPCYIWDGVFIGLTASKSMRNTMLLAFAVFMLVFYGQPSSWGNHGLWFTMLVFMAARGLFQQIFFLRKGIALN